MSSISGATPPGAHGRNPALDTLRAIAIAAVVAIHAVPLSQPVSSTVRTVLALGERGVDLFFVLSGYLIGGIAIREIVARGSLRLGNFWRRRWMRTLPAYYVTFLLYALKQLLPHKSKGLGVWPSYLVFLQTYVMQPLEDFAHSWSLCVEEHFYIVLPLLLVAMARLHVRSARGVLVAIVIVGVTFASIRTGFILATGTEPSPRLTHWRTDALCVGVALAALEQNGSHLFAWLRAHRLLAWLGAGTLVGAATCAQLMGHPAWQTLFALACGAWVALAIGGDRHLVRLGATRTVGFVSTVSYSLYLLHPLVLSTMEVVLRRLPRGLPQLGLHIALSVPVSLIAAWLSYRVVERTFLRLRDRASTGGVDGSPAESRGG